MLDGTGLDHELGRPGGLPTVRAASGVSAYLARIPQVLGTVARNREQRSVLLAFLAFNAAEWATWLALTVYAYDRGGATTAGLLAFGMLVPATVVAPVLAILPDRYRAGRVLAIGYFVEAVVTLLLGAAMLADAPFWAVVGLAVAYASAYTIIRPTQAALLPTLARTPRELTASNVAASWVESLGVLIAPLTVALLLLASEPAAVMLVYGAVLLVAAVVVLPVPGPPPLARAEATSAFGEVTDGLTLLRDEREPRMLVLLVGAQYVGVGALDVLYVVIAVEALQNGDAWSGYLNAAFGIGGMIGIVATVALVGRARLIPPLLAGLGAWAVALGVLALVPQNLTALACLACAGIGHTVVDVSGRTLLQRAAPADLLARVFGLLEGLSSLALAIGAILVPILIGLGDWRVAVVGVALTLPLAAALASRRLAEIDRTADVPVVEIGLLRSNALFAELDPPTLESVAGRLEPLTASAGTDIVVQGDVGERWFAIAGGLVEVVRDGEQVAILGRGEGFGEIALLRGVRRTATVSALEECQLYALAKDDFLEAVTGHPGAVAEAERVVEARLPTPAEDEPLSTVSPR